MFTIFCFILAWLNASYEKDRHNAKLNKSLNEMTRYLEMMAGR